MANQIHELKGPHAKATRLTHTGIHRGGIGSTFLQKTQALGVIRPGHTVHDKAGRGTRMHWGFAPGSGGCK